MTLKEHLRPGVLLAKIIRQLRLSNVSYADYEAASDVLSTPWRMPAIGYALNGVEVDVRATLFPKRSNLFVSNALLTQYYTRALGSGAPGTWLWCVSSRDFKVNQRMGTFITPTLGKEFSLTHGLFAMQFAHMMEHFHGWRLVIHEDNYFAYQESSNTAMGVMQGEVIGLKAAQRLDTDTLIKLSNVRAPIPSKLIRAPYRKLNNALLLKVSEHSYAVELLRLYAATKAVLGNPSDELLEDQQVETLLRANLGSTRKIYTIGATESQKKTAVVEALNLLEEPPEGWKPKVLKTILVPLVINNKTFNELMFSELETTSGLVDPIAWDRAKRYVLFLQEKLHGRTGR